MELLVARRRGSLCKLISEAQKIKGKERLVAALSGCPSVPLRFHVMLPQERLAQHP